MSTRHSLALLLVLLVGALGPASARAADGLTIRADAGLGGAAKPARWTPVRILIDNTGAAVTGEVIVDWGSARVRRPMTLASPSHRLIDVYVRTTDVRGAITVSFLSAGRTLAVVEAPVRILRADEPLIVCVGGFVDASCMATLSADAAPHSWRGYDAADQVNSVPANDVALSADQRLARETWREARRLEAAGSVATAPRMPDASHTSLLLGAIGLGVYLVALVSAVVIATKWRWRPLALVAMFGGLILVGSVAAFDAGRAGPASVVVIQQATVIEQFADTRGSLVSGRAVAEFPMYDHFELQSSVIDGAIDLLPTPRDRSEHRENEGGHPIVAGVFGSGATQAFSLDAATDLQFFTIVRAGPVLTVANVSGAEFTDCRFGSRATTDLQILGTLGPGARASTDQANGMDDPTLTCVTQSSLLEFSDPRHPVTTSGSTLVIVHLTPETAP